MQVLRDDQTHPTLTPNSCFAVNAAKKLTPSSVASFSYLPDAPSIKCLGAVAPEKKALRHIAYVCERTRSDWTNFAQNTTWLLAN